MNNPLKLHTIPSPMVSRLVVRDITEETADIGACTTCEAKNAKRRAVEARIAADRANEELKAATVEAIEAALLDEDGLIAFQAEVEDAVGVTYDDINEKWEPKSDTYPSGRVYEYMAPRPEFSAEMERRRVDLSRIREEAEAQSAHIEDPSERDRASSDAYDRLHRQLEDEWRAWRPLSLAARLERDAVLAEEGIISPVLEPTCTVEAPLEDVSRVNHEALSAFDAGPEKP